MKYLNKENARWFLIMALILFGVSIYGFARDLKPPIEISTLEELNNNLGNKIVVNLQKISDTGVMTEIISTNRKSRTSTKYHFYATRMSDVNVILTSNNLKELDDVRITGIVCDTNSKIGNLGQAFDYFKKSKGHFITEYNQYGIDVISDNILILDIVIAGIAVVMLTCSIISFRRK